MTFGPSPWILLNCFPDRKEDHSKAEGTSTALRIPLRLLLVPLLDGADGVPGGLEHLQLRLPGEVPGHPRDHARLAEEDQGRTGQHEFVHYYAIFWSQIQWMNSKLFQQWKK